MYSYPQQPINDVRILVLTGQNSANIIRENMDKMVNECERKTGMHLFMVAAMGKNYDLDTIRPALMLIRIPPPVTACRLSLRP